MSSLDKWLRIIEILLAAIYAVRNKTFANCSVELQSKKEKPVDIVRNCSVLYINRLSN